ncbi:MAG TPA: dihydrolipoamide acetyltransferase family protein [Dehalococcoidia bacterium]|jgi:pyruvate dehydrogenase E2 component (dihydrolipoamide acetyltransferase)
MISEVVMPQMGADMKEGTVLRWLKNEGQEVARGEIIAEIETDKANIEIEAFDAGVFRKVLVPEGDTVEVGTVIAVIAAPEDDISQYAAGAGTKAASPSSSSAPAETPSSRAEPTPSAPAPSPAPSFGAPEPPPAVPASGTRAEPSPAAPSHDSRLRASPVARRLAKEAGIDISRITGTGPDGRIVRRDVEVAAQRPQAVAPSVTTAPPAQAPRAAPPAAAPSGPGMPAPGSVIDVPLNRIRQTIARRMAQSKREAPHYYLTVEVDMTEAVRMRAQINEAIGEGGRVSINDLLVLACTRALQRHPRFNSWWMEDHVQMHGRINIGIAIALDDGLIAPAVLDCQAKTLTQIAHDARSLAERARSGAALTAEEYSAGTFTVSNLGAYGVDTLVAIINPPQTAILGVGRVAERAVVQKGEIAVRSMMTLALSADHRATDGAEGARFLQTLKQLLEAPALIFV